MKRHVLAGWLVITCLMYNCRTKTTDCEEDEFLVFTDRYEIRARFDLCDPSYKHALVIANSEGKVIYEADSLLEFEFKETRWPTFLSPDSSVVQFLLYVNDRPSKDWILGVAFRGDSLLGTQRLPYFDIGPFDYDNDGKMEWGGRPNFVEPYSEDSTYYDPIYFVEETPEGIRIDSTLTKAVNTKLFGGFWKSHTGVFKKIQLDFAM